MSFPVTCGTEKPFPYSTGLAFVCPVRNNSLSISFGGWRSSAIVKNRLAIRENTFLRYNHKIKAIKFRQWSYTASKCFKKIDKIRLWINNDNNPLSDFVIKCFVYGFVIKSFKNSNLFNERLCYSHVYYRCKFILSYL